MGAGWFSPFSTHFSPMSTHFSGLFYAFFPFFFAFLCFSWRTRTNNSNLLQKMGGISLRPRLHRPRAKLPEINWIKQCPADGVRRMPQGSVSRHCLLDTAKPLRMLWVGEAPEQFKSRYVLNHFVLIVVCSAELLVVRLRILHRF